MDFLKKLILVKLATFDILLLARYICIVLVTRPHQLQGMLLYHYPCLNKCFYYYYYYMPKIFCTSLGNYDNYIYSKY